MESGPGKPAGGLRYAADEPPPHPASFILGLQVAVLVCTPVVVVTAIVTRAANLTGAYLSWAIFASMVIGGLTTIVQARRVAGVGSANLMVMGASGASIGVAVLALAAGGPALLAVLVIASGLFQLGLAARLVLLRRIITPVVSGTLMALISVTVMPMGFALLIEVPSQAPTAAGPTVTLVTATVVLGLMLRAPRLLRAWTPVVALALGSATAALFGIFDLTAVREAGWFGIPATALPGLDAGFDSSFWLLLPAFLFVALVITVRQIGDAIVMQRLSRREQKAIDFRRVQGAVAACGAGTVLSGIAGVLPIWPYPAGIGMAEGIGVAARRVGVYIGAIFIGLAFVPKIGALVLSIPGPVLGAYIVVVIGLVFARGMRVVFQTDGGRNSSLIAGFSFWVGVGIQFQAIFPQHLGTPAAQMLANGLTAGGITILLLNLFLELTGPRRRRTEMPLSPDSLRALDEFVVGFAGKYGWDGEGRGRLRAASEEALLSLARQEEDGSHAGDRRLRVVARNDRTGAILEFSAATDAGNLENQIVLLGDIPDLESKRDLSLRLLRHYASSVKHQQYHNADVVTIRVDR